MWRNRIILLACVGLLAPACTSDSGVSRRTAVEADATSTSSTATDATAVPDGTTPGDGTTPSIGTLDVSDIPIGDDALRTGTLPNGLTYYIRDNDNPGGSAELRLAINAGSGRQDTDQTGVAHFLEHMLFNGTDQFPKNDLIDVLRKTGASFGADINAYTSFDETVYQLNVPTADDTSLDTGLDVLSQWLSAATLDPTEVASERGVVLEEWRSGAQSSDGRVFDELDRMFLGGSVYEGREPIGTSDAIEAMTPELLRRFYDDWYRPDNAAVVVIGEIDVDAVLAGIENRFAPIEARAADQAAAALTISPSTTPVVGRLADPDLTSSAIEVALPLVAAPERVDTVFAGVADALAFTMIANRLSDDATTTDAAFDDAHEDSDSFVRGIDAPSVVVDAKPDRSAEAMLALLDEFERAHRFGFDETELGRAVSQLRSAAETTYAARDTRQDADYADTYAHAFLLGSPILTEQATYDLTTAVLDAITVDDVGATFERRWSSSAAHVIVTGPESESSTLPSLDAISAAIADLPNRPVTAREPVEAVSGELMEPPAPVTETGRSSLTPYPDVQIADPVELDFGNGVTVLLENTDIADGELVLQAQSNGGAAGLMAQDVVDSYVAPDVVTTGGVSTFDQAQLDQLLADSTADLSPSIAVTSDRFDGSSSTDDLEQLLQLVHLYMTAPRFDQVALDNSVSRIRSDAADPTADQSNAAYDALYRLRYGDSPLYRYQLTAADADSVDLAGIERVWTKDFGNANGWTFAIVGDIDVDTVTQLARTYLGTLPSTGSDETPVAAEPDPPAGIVSQAVHAGTGDKATLIRLYSTRVPAGVRSDVLADVATEVLSHRILTRIREELGESYSPYASFGVTPDDLGGDGHLDLYLEIATSPDQIDSVSTVVTEELAKLAAGPPTQDEIDSAISVVAEQYLIYNEEIAAALIATRTGIGESTKDYVNRYSVLYDISPDEIAAVLALPAGLDRYVEVRALPR